jgi:3-oxoacyl-[acyl-carrier protein] reductase
VIPRDEGAGAEDRAFEEIAVGDEAAFEATIEAVDLDEFARLSGDRNPRHMEAHPPFRDRIVHGAFLTSLFSRLVGMKLPGRRCVYLAQQTEFLRPAFPGDTVRVEGKVLTKDEVYRRLEIKTVVRRGTEVLASGKATVTMIELPTEVRMDVQGKRIVVTGGSRGIGRAVAKMLGRAGARVVLSYRSHPEEGEAVAGEIREQGGEAHAAFLDLSDRASVGSFFDSAERALGGLDAAVCSAAPSLARNPIAKLEWPLLLRDLEFIVGGTLACMQEATPRLIQAGGGSIVLVLTSAVLGQPPPGLASYVAAKSALAGLSKVLAVELGPKRVRVNSVSPGLTETDMTADIPQLLKNRLLGGVPAGRTAQPDDVAGVVLFLCSDASRYITGANLPVTGGGWMP